MILHSLYFLLGVLGKGDFTSRLGTESTVGAGMLIPTEVGLGLEGVDTRGVA